MIYQFLIRMNVFLFCVKKYLFMNKRKDIQIKHNEIILFLLLFNNKSILMIVNRLQSSENHQ